MQETLWRVTYQKDRKICLNKKPAKNKKNGKQFKLFFFLFH